MSPTKVMEAPVEPMAKVIVNDLSIEMATANGTGSQSANSIFSKTLFRMGIPVGPKNLFPSNIQGLPTWFTIRISRQGYTARKKELDWLVGMNPDSWEKDVKDLLPGRVVLYNSSELSDGPLKSRPDLIAYPVPISDLVRDKIPNPQLRKLLANVVYVGALAQLLCMDPEILFSVIRDNFKSKPKAVDINLLAARVGIEYARERLPKKDPYRVEAMTGEKNANTGKILVDGNTMSALGCLMGGCTVLAWYPITPSSSLCETLIGMFEKFRVDPATGEHRYAAVQCEDELASIGVVLGAGWAGARALTSTAGPGLSLMNEFAGYGYYAEVPGVIFDVQRVGPSTGLPTRTSQGDILEAVYCSHGDTEHIVLIPGSPEECCEFGRIAFDLAEQFQTPVFVLTDLDLGMNFWTSEIPPYPTQGFKRGKVLKPADLDKIGTFGRYLDVDGDGVPWRTLPGNPHPKAAYFTRGSGHTEYATYSEDPDTYARNLDRLKKKLETARGALPRPRLEAVPGARIGLIAFGSTHNAMREARDQLAEAGLKTNYLRIVASPLPLEELRKFFDGNDCVYLIEQNRDGQMEICLRAGLRDGCYVDKIRGVHHYNGLPIDARTISDGVLALERRPVVSSGNNGSGGGRV